MAKRIFYDDDARTRVLKGAEIIYNAVRTTMGPKGRNVIIGKDFGPGVITHDGVEVARSIEVPVTEETLGYKIGADLVKAAALKMNDLAGDGTTTVTVLTYHVLKEANKLIAAGHNPMELRTQLERASKAVLEALKASSEDITETSAKVAQIATISAGDKEVGKLVADVIKKIGKDGIVTVEEGQGLELESEVVKGYTFDKGFISPYMVTDPSRMEAVLEKPLILVTDIKIRANQDFLPLVEAIAKTGQKNLVIIAEDVEGEALQTFILNKLKGTFMTLCIKAPSFGDFRIETLQDIAILTGGQLISESNGSSLATINDLSVLGKARRVISTQNETTVVEGAGIPEDVEVRIKQIEEQSKNADNNYNKDRYKQRAAALGGKVAVIRIGGVTETEIEEKTFRVDDAVHAVKAALAEGIVPGGGATLYHLASTLQDNSMGATLLHDALLMPFNILMANSGLEAAAYTSQLNETTGVDVRSGQVVDLKEAGIVDPTLVTKEAIQNAVSIAGTAMTMGALIIEEPVEKTDTMPPMAGAR